MKKMYSGIVMAFCCLMFLASAQAQSGAPSQNMLVSGFKQALSIGTEKAVQTVSKPDGYFGNQAIKILLPDSMQKVADVLGKLGMQKQVDDFIVSQRGGGRQPAARARRLRWCVIIFLYVLAETALISFVNLYLFEYRAAPERVAIQAIAWFWAIMLVGRLLCSILPSTLADRKLIAGAMLSGATAILLTIPMPGWPGALAAILAASFLMAGTWPTIMATTAHENAGRASAVVGITVAAGAVGCILAPPIMGLLFGLIPPALAMAAPAIPLLAGGMFAAAAPRRQAGQLEAVPAPAK